MNWLVFWAEGSCNYGAHRSGSAECESEDEARRTVAEIKAGGYPDMVVQVVCGEDVTETCGG